MSVRITEDEFKSAIESCGYPKLKHQLYSYTKFRDGLSKAGIKTKREAAMFMTQIIHESGGLKKNKEDNPPRNAYDYNDNGIQFCGRGYIQLTWKANYQAASRALFNDDRLVRDPEFVAQDEDTAWNTSFWYWKTNVHDASGVSDGKFGATTKAINPMECEESNKRANELAKVRFEKYKQVLKAFGIKEKPDESGCYPCGKDRLQDGRF